jgi:hypothetical protein
MMAAHKSVEMAAQAAAAVPMHPLAQLVVLQHLVKAMQAVRVLQAQRAAAVAQDQQAVQALADQKLVAQELLDRALIPHGDQ